MEVESSSSLLYARFPRLFFSTPAISTLALLHHESRSTMRISLFALAIGAISQVRAQAHINLTAAAELPPCVIQCAVAVYPSLNCTPADPCYCAKTGPVADALLACVTRACDGFKESLQGLRFQAESCGWERDRNVGPQTRDLANSLFGLASFFLFGRIASRWPRWGGAGYWWDDRKCLYSSAKPRRTG